MVKSKYFIFGVKEKNVLEARARLATIEDDVIANLKRMGVKAKSLNGTERLEILHEYFHQDRKNKFHFSYAEAARSGYGVSNAGMHLRFPPER